MPTHAQYLARLREISAEVDRLAALPELTRQQETRWQELTAEFDRVNAAREAKEQLADVVRSGAAHMERGTPDYGHDPYGPDATRQGPELMRRVGDPWAAEHDGAALTGPRARDLALAAVERSTAPDGGREKIVRGLDGQTDDVSRLAQWTRATSDPAYTSAFTKLLRDPEGGHREFDDNELRAYRNVKTVARSLSLTDSAGGFLIPFALDPSVLLTSDGSVNPIRQLARNMVTTSDVHHFVTSEGVTVGFAAEFAEASDNSPTLAEPSIQVHKMQGFVPISIEAMQDAQNIEAEVGRMFVDAVEQLEAEKFVTGSGSGEPFGFITALAGTGSVVAESVANNFSAADVYAVEAALAPRFRPNAQWAANLATIHTAAQFETTNGALKFPEISEGRLLRRPLNEVSFMDGTLTAASNNHILALGDWSQYAIVDRVGTSLEFIPHLLHTANNRPYGARGWYMHKRLGADVLIDNAFRVLNVSVA